jgi:hypothetical protein
MAVNEPGAGVVKLKRDSEVSIWRENSDVSTRGVLGVE